MTSAREKQLTLDLIARMLREHGLDERRAGAVLEALRVRPEPLSVTALAPVASGANEAATRPTGQAAALAPTGVAATGLAATMRLQEARLDGAPDASLLAPIPQSDSSTPSAAPISFGPDSDRLVPGPKLGAGGMGEVVRVRDHSLRRSLAMKVLLPEINLHANLREHFIQEAQVTAQLAHPGIPPVHELGTLEDTRPFFTMKEVHGATLAGVIAEAHRDPVGRARWSEGRLLEIFQKVCEAVAYAHARGVVHCDLKPDNVMVGAFGEVLVMDWGVARLVAPSRATPEGEAWVTVGGTSTAEAFVAGTPAYMPPEQASAHFDRIGPPADVYALGVILYELLAGTRPYRGTPRELLEKARAGVIPPIPPRAGSNVDDALLAIITRAMAPEPEQRYHDAKAMADELALWREGAMRREKALATVREAQAMIPEIEPTFAEAADLRERAARELAQLGPDASFESKEPAWAMLDQAASLASNAMLRQVEAEQLLFNALAHAPDLTEAKSLISQMRFNRHRDAERRRAWDEAAGHELVMRANDTGELRDYLEGTAPLTIVTTPPCDVRLHRVVRRARRLVPELVRELGRTPLVDVELPVGSYLLELVGPGLSPVRYPLLLRRREGWAGRRPGDAQPFAVPIPPGGAIAPGEIVVAAGCCELGGDELAPGAHRTQRVWVDGFVIREHPVTFGELAAFLADREGEPFRREVFRDGVEVWRADWPAVGLSWNGAKAYAAWLSTRTGRGWRLPTEIEWEKAARGVDGRFYPWGDFTDPAFVHSRTVERSPTTPAPIDAFAADVSPYGVRGMGGNVRDWCEDAAGSESYSASGGIARPPPDAPDAALRIVRGGSWRQAPDAARVAGRTALAAANGYADVGFRLVRGL